MTTAYLFSGYPASGKSTALKVAYANGLYTVEMGKVVRDEFRNQFEKDIDDNNLGDWATRQKKAFGPGIVAEWAIDRVSLGNMNNDDVAISGIRCEEEIERFRSYPEFDEVVVVGIRTTPRVRFERMKDRDDVDREYFEERNAREREWGVEKVLNRHTDTILRNSTCTEERFSEKVARLFR